MKLLDAVRQVMRTKRYSYRTEQCYVAWVQKYVRYCKGAGPWRHPQELGALEVERFLTHLAVEQRVSASTQNQALNALVFLYGQVVKKERATCPPCAPFAVSACPPFSRARRRPRS